jgi:hypothetical protein
MVDEFAIRGVIFNSKQKDVKNLLNKSSHDTLENSSIELKLDLALKRLEQIAEEKFNSNVKSKAVEKELELARKKINQFEVKNSDINAKLNRAIQSVRSILEN